MTVGDLLSVIDNRNAYIEIQTYDTLDTFEWFDRAKYSKYFDCEVNSLDVRFETEWGDPVITLNVTFARPKPSAHIQGLIESQKIDVNLIWKKFGKT